MSSNHLSICPFSSKISIFDPDWLPSFSLVNEQGTKRMLCQSSSIKVSQHVQFTLMLNLLRHVIALESSMLISLKTRKKINRDNLEWILARTSRCLHFWKNSWNEQFFLKWNSLPYYAFSLRVLFLKEIAKNFKICTLKKPFLLDNFSELGTLVTCSILI